MLAASVLSIIYWSPLNYIFALLLLYLAVLVIFTFYRGYVLIRGIFWSMVTILGLLLSLLCYIFNNMFLKQMSLQCSYLLVNPSWAFPEIGFSLNFDCLAYLFIFLVCAIGFCTNLYALNYFKNEATEDSFFLIINWFIFSMILLVLADNFFTLFLGWELIGLTSFFLINFWSERRGTLKSSFKAFVFNKVSDFFLFIFIIILWFLTGKSNIHHINTELFDLIDSTNNYWYIAGVSLIICSSIKSAQVIGHLWLPDSMEAPVPASALIHSATLVSAGLYLLMRFNILIHFLQLHYIILIIGSLTAAYGGIIAASQTDVKKLLAYSTISHCGFLFVCTTLQNYYLVVIYLFLHGLFKAMTFFCVGTFIRVANSQDTRKMGILSRYIPVDTVFLIICSSNLGGLPFTLGYLYKNLFMVYFVNSAVNFIVIGLCFIGMLSSIVYVYRLVYYSAFDFNKGSVNLGIKLLQDNKSSNKNLWSASTILQSVVIFFLLGFTLYIYILFYTYFQTSSLIIESFPIVMENSENLTKINENLYLVYINCFYAIYIIIITILIFIECRRSYTWQRKLHFLIFLVIFTFSLLFLFLLFSVRTSFSRIVYTAKL